MSLKNLIDGNLKFFLLKGDRDRANTLRGLKAVILNEEIAKNQRSEGLDDATIEQLIMREIKKRRESVEIYTQAKRDELAQKEESEIETLSVYLPKQLSLEELNSLIDDVMSNFEEVTVKDMGIIISSVKDKVGSSANGGEIAKLVKDKLNKLN